MILYIKIQMTYLNNNIRFKIAFILVFILSGCSSQTKFQFDVAKQSNTIKEYQKFLDNNPNSEYKAEALYLYEKAIYEEAIEKNIPEVYSEYIKQFPGGEFVNSVSKKLQDITIKSAFEKTKEENTEEAYFQFINKYPESKYAFDAEKLLYRVKIETSPDLLSVLESNGIQAENVLEKNIFLREHQLKVDSTKVFVSEQGNVDFFYNEPDITELPNDQVLIAQAPSQFIDVNLGEGIPTIQDSLILEKITRENIALNPNAIKEIPDTRAQIPKNKLGTDLSSEQSSSSNSPAQNFSLKTSTPIQYKNTPNKVLYSKNYSKSNPPSVSQDYFHFFITVLERTASKIAINVIFQKNNLTSAEVKISRINLVNSGGKRVKPIEIIGDNWDYSLEEGLKINDVTISYSGFKVIFPAYNLFFNNEYKLYVTINSKNYLLQI